VGKAGELLDKHFAVKSAIRDFNQTMPMVLPTGFEMHRYVVCVCTVCVCVCTVCVFVCV